MRKKKQPSKPLTDQQREAVRLLCIEDKKVQEAAAILGVHRCTIWRWSRTKAFQKEWDQQRKAFVKQWRHEMGYDYGQERKTWKKELKRLEQKVKIESGKIRNGNTRAFDKAWAEYSHHLFSGMDRLEKKIFRP